MRTGPYAKTMTNPPPTLQTPPRPPARTLALLRLLTAIQDEAHRVAGRYRTGLHQKRQTRFRLESIAGIGPARRRLLLKHFQTITGVAEADLPALLAVRGLDEKTARAVYRHFHQPDQEG